MSRTFESLKEHTAHHQVTRSATVLGGSTFVSRLLGFVRDVLIARAFGTGPQAQAFVVAFVLPNLLRDLVAEGAASAAVVPTLVAYLRKGKDRFWELVYFLLNHVLLILGGLTLLGIGVAPLLVAVTAPGFLGDPEQFRLTVFLTRVLFPFIFLMGLSAYATAVLNTLQHFFVPSLGSSLLNLCMIASLIFWVPYVEPGILALAIGVLVGGVVQLFVQFPALQRQGFQYRSQVSFRHPGVQQAGRLFLPRIVGTAVYQLSVVVDRVFASLAHIVGEGGVAALYYSNRVVQLPFALVGVSFATAALPTLSGQAHEKDLQEFRRTLLFSLKSVFFLMVPAVIGIMVLARPIVQLLFERGSFDAYSTGITAQALFFYGMGLLSFSGAKILASAFYSLQDTRTPVKAAALSLLMNTLLNGLLMFPLKIGGIALATAISSTFHFFFLYHLLKKRIGSLGGRTLFHAFLRYCGPGILMAFCLVWASSFFLGDGASVNVPVFVTVMILGGFSYFFFAYLFRIEEASRLKQWIFKKR